VNDLAAIFHLQLVPHVFLSRKKKLPISYLGAPVAFCGHGDVSPLGVGG